MLLTEAHQKLAFGPLSELSIGGNGTGVIPPDKLPQVNFRINNALIALYTRFPLRLKTVELETVTGIHTYFLRREFAQTSPSTELNKYLKDHPSDPFLGDVSKIHGVIDAATGMPLPLNDQHNELSWFLPSFDSLRMGYPRTGDRYWIEFRARHEEIPLQPQDPGTVELVLPPELHPAFLAHVAGHVYGNMSMEGALAKSQNHLATYEAECQFHEERNTFDQWATDSNIKMQLGGWI